MQKYELFLILPGTLDDKQVEAKAGEMVSLIKEYGEEVEMHPMGKNRLSYPIKQIRYGYFYTITFSADGAKTKELEEKLRLNREILRFLMSHFSTNLTAQQKIAYTTDSSGITRMVEKEGEVVKAAEKKAEKLDINEINKKLDDLIGGDVIPGV